MIRQWAVTTSQIAAIDPINRAASLYRPGAYPRLAFKLRIHFLINQKYLISILRSPGRFYARLVEHEKDHKNTPTDVYIWMLGVDFICFIIIMFGYWAFGKHNENISSDITVEIKENVVPTSFLYLLFTHFFLILIGKLKVIIV